MSKPKDRIHKLERHLAELRRPKRRIDKLERQLAELRAEMAALRDGLADRITTRRIVVTDDDRVVDIEPGRLKVASEDSTGASIRLAVTGIDVRDRVNWAGIIVGSRDSSSRLRNKTNAGYLDTPDSTVSFEVVSTPDTDRGEARYARLAVNGVALAIPEPAR